MSETSVNGKQRHDIAGWGTRDLNGSLCHLEAAGLQLFVRQLERHPGVEHGSPKFAPHQMVGQAKDLRRELNGSLGRKDCGAAKTCRGKKKQTKKNNKSSENLVTMTE